MTLANFFGVLAGFVSTIAFLPQALKVWRAQSTRGISKGMYVLYCLGLLLWGIYAWMIEAWPLLVTEIVTGIMTGYILVMTIRGFDD
jgi:MtN3 and saliva related transmembrane protein